MEVVDSSTSIAESVQHVPRKLVKLEEVQIVGGHEVVGAVDEARGFSDVQFSATFKRMSGLLEQLKKNVVSAVDGDEHNDVDANATLQRELTIMTHSRRKLAVSKIKASATFQAQRSKRGAAKAAQQPVAPEVKEPATKKQRSANHHSFFGIFELKEVWGKGRLNGISPECKKHRSHNDTNDCARSLTLRGGSEQEVVRKLRMWLALGASVDEARLYLLRCCD